MRKFFYKMIIANTFIFSFALTKWYQLSPIRCADGFETTDCLECLQILDVLYMAGGRNNKGLLLRDTSHLLLKFIEFP